MDFSPANRKAVVLLTLVFALGIAFGAVGVVLGPRISSLWQADANQPQQTSRLARELNLTAQQQQQFDAVLRETQARYDSIRREMNPQFDAARAAGRDQIRQILTPEQRPGFEEFMSRSRNRRSNPTRMVSRLTEALNLTAEQQTRLSAVLNDTQTHFEALRQQMNPRFDEVRQQSREQMRQIVTPEQRPVLDDFLRRRDERRLEQERRRREIC
jgi:Spy/CpxP family protein refolding chaperone